MEVVVALILCALFAFLFLLIIEPPTTQQRTNEVKRKIEREKERGIAEIDAITEAHDQQVFDLLSRASQKIVEQQEQEARQRVEEVMAQAAKES